MRFACCGAALIAVLTLGVGGAVGRGFATTTTVRVEVLGVGEIVDDNHQLDCGNGHTACRVSYTGTGMVTFDDVSPAPTGWTFSDISGCGDPCTVNLDQADDDHELIATFDPAQSVGTATITLASNGDTAGDGGTVEGDDIDCQTGDTSDCTEDVPVGSTLTVVETPDDGFVFTGWTGICTGTARSCTTIMSQDRSGTASFRKPRLAVTVNGNGTVTGGGIACTNGTGTCTADEDAGDEITLQATVPAGGSFTDWGGACTGKDLTCTFTMTADRTVTANFSGGTTAPTTYPLSASVAGNGTVTGGGLNCGTGGSTCSANVNAGTSVTLTATPATGETFQSWGGACSGTAKTCALTMSAARNVSATFSGGSSATVELSVTVTGRGTVTGGGVTCGNGRATCTAKVKQDSTVGLTATPAAGAKFVGWGGACSGTAPTCTVQMSEAKKVTAAFQGGVGPGADGRIGGTAACRSGGRDEDGVGVRGHPALPDGGARAGADARAARRARRDRPGVHRRSRRRDGRPVPGRQTRASTSSSCASDRRRSAGPPASAAAASTPRRRRSRSPAGFRRATDAGALWSLTLHFRSSQAASGVVHIYRSKRLVRTVRFPIRAGVVVPGALLLSPGTYRVALTATDSVGRIRALTWYALLP